MNHAVRGDGAVRLEFDERVRMIEELKDESAEIAVRELLDWINNDAKVRRNLNGRRYEKLVDYIDQAPDHAVWAKVEVMIQTRQLQNSVARKLQIRAQREAERS